MLIQIACIYNAHDAIRIRIFGSRRPFSHTRLDWNSPDECGCEISTGGTTRKAVPAPPKRSARKIDTRARASIRYRAREGIGAVATRAHPCSNLHQIRKTSRETAEPLGSARVARVETGRT